MTLFHTSLEGGDQSLEEQAQTILTAYLQEYWNAVPALDHPAFGLMRQITNERLKVRLILAALQRVQQDISLDTGQNAHLIRAIILDHLTYTGKEIKEMLQRIGSIFAKEPPYEITEAIIALVDRFESFLRQADVLAMCQSELEALYAPQAHVWGRNPELVREIYRLHVLFGDLLFGDKSPGLVSLLRNDSHAGSQFLEEQAQILLAAYQQELGNYDTSWSNPQHPALETLQQASSERLKVCLILAAIQELSTLMYPSGGDEPISVRQMIDLINAMSTETLPYTTEDVQSILRESVRIFSQEIEWRSKSDVSRTLFALLRQCEPLLRRADLFASCQSELVSLSTLAAQWDDYATIKEAYYTRVLIGNLLFAGNPPGLASLLREYAHDGSLAIEEQARTVLAVYRQEMGDYDGGVDHPLLELVKQETSELLKVRLLRVLLQEIYSSLQEQVFQEQVFAHYVHLPADSKQMIKLMKILFSESLPYSREDIQSLLECMGSIFAPPNNFYDLIDENLKFSGLNHSSFFLNVLNALVRFLQQPEMLAFCRQETVQLYAAVSQCAWSGQNDNVNLLRLLLRALLFPESKGALRDLLEDNGASFESDAEMQTLLAAYHQDLARGMPSWCLEPEVVQLFQQTLTPQAVLRLICLAAEEGMQLQAQHEHPGAEKIWHLAWQDLLLIQSLCQQSLPFNPEDVHTLLHGTLACTGDITQKASLLINTIRTIAFLLTTLAPQFRQPEVIERCYEDLKAIQQVVAGEGWHTYSAGQDRRLQLKLNDLLSKRQQQFHYPLLPDAWASPILEELSALPVTQRDAWLAVVNHCVSAKGSTLSQSWLKQARSLSEAVGSEIFTRTVHRWISFFSDKKGERMDGENSNILRGLIWFCNGSSERMLAAILADSAIEGYRKIAGLGPRCPKVGDAAVTTLESMRGRDAISQLERVRQHVKQPSYQAKVEQALDAVAKRENMTRIDLEELTVSTFDLHDGQLQMPVGAWTAQLRVGGREVQRHWIDPEGKPRSSLPAAVKRTVKEELKAVTRQADDIEHLVNAQRDRLERMFINERHWPLEDWRARYLEHPLLSVLAQRLIWRVRSGEQSWLVIWHDGRLVDVNTQPVEFPDQAEVMLWHPLMSSSEEVLRWCLWLEAQLVTQPFKQAHREIYPLTEAERASGRFSQRFAGHIVRQHQLNALARARDWNFALHSNFSSAISGDPVSLNLPQLGLRAEFVVNRQQDEDEEISRYLITSHVRFALLQLALHGYFHPMQLQSLEQIPPIIFSEVMRDVDLFVSVTSAGADPNRDEQPALIQDYWRTYNQSDLSLSAQGRKQVLERLVPRLGIGERCSLEDRFLRVQGDLCTYRIHLGSGNILMEPEHKYLCIVFNAKSGEDGQFLLPFEGDQLLALILSKAFLLADDTHIKDKSILSQIRSR